MSGVVTDHALAANFLPPAFGLTVVHEQIALAQRTGGAEVQHLSVYGPPVHEGGVAERSIRDYNRFAAYRVVYQLVLNHNLDGVPPCLAVDVHHLHGFQVMEPVVGIAQ